MRVDPKVPLHRASGHRKMHGYHVVFAQHGAGVGQSWLARIAAQQHAPTTEVADGAHPCLALLGMNQGEQGDGLACFCAAIHQDNPSVDVYQAVRRLRPFRPLAVGRTGGKRLGEPLGTPVGEPFGTPFGTPLHCGAKSAIPQQTTAATSHGTAVILLALAAHHIDSYQLTAHAASAGINAFLKEHASCNENPALIDALVSAVA